MEGSTRSSIKHMLKKGLSEMLDGRHVACSRASDQHRSLIRGSSGVDSSDGHDLHRNRTTTMRSDRSSPWRRIYLYVETRKHHKHLMFIGRVK